MVFNHDLPKANELVRLVVLFVHSLQRPINPTGRRSGARIPVRNQDVQCLLDQSSYLVVTL